MQKFAHMQLANVYYVPRRIFLDTGTFQALADCGEFIFGEEDFPSSDDYKPGKCPQILRRADAQDILKSLQGIFFVNERAHFEWIVSANSLNEVDAGEACYRSNYVREILDHSLACLGENPPTGAGSERVRILDSPAVGYLSGSDRALLMDACEAECDTFLTIEKRLPRISENVRKLIPLWIATPQDLWKFLIPHLKGL